MTYDPSGDHTVYNPPLKEIWAKAQELKKEREAARCGESSVIPAQEMRTGYEIKDDEAA